MKNGKPAPDIYLLAAERFGDGVKPGINFNVKNIYFQLYFLKKILLYVEKCLAFEDSANGILSARAANMQVKNHSPKYILFLFF